MEQRHEFLEAAVRGEHSFTELCRRFGISRKNGYKWLNRYHIELAVPNAKMVQVGHMRDTSRWSRGDTGDKFSGGEVMVVSRQSCGGLMRRSFGVEDDELDGRPVSWRRSIARRWLDARARTPRDDSRARHVRRPTSFVAPLHRSPLARRARSYTS